MERAYIVLAAGLGTRMYKDFPDTPKTLLNIGDKPILQHIYNAIEGLGDVYAVVGGKADKVEGYIEGHNLPIYPIFNPFYEASNNMVSLWLALKDLKNKYHEITVINGDTWFTRKTAERLHGSKGDMVLCVSKKAVCPREDMKVYAEHNIITNLGKELDTDKAVGEFIGVFRTLCPNELHDSIDRTLHNRWNLNLWMESGILGLMGDIDIRMLDIEDDPYIEVDFPEDLEKANELQRRYCSELLPE